MGVQEMPPTDTETVVFSLFFLVLITYIQYRILKWIVKKGVMEALEETASKIERI